MRSIYRFLLQIIICSMLMLPAGSLNIVYADGSTEVGSGDTGSSGTGSTDSGNSGNGSSDTGTSDTGSSESGSTDTGTSGTGSTDDDESDDSEPENSDAAANPDWSYTLSTAEVTITGYNGTATDVVIPDSLEGFPVTSVSDGAFYGKNITSITIPLLLDTIDKNAFRNCKYLTHIYFNSAMCGKIGADAFAGAGKSASSLTVHFGSNVTAVPDGLFDTTGSSGDYPRITSVILPNTVSIVGNKSFKGCAAIKSVDWNRGLTMIGKEAFSGCKRLTSIELPETVEMLGSAAFSDCIKVKRLIIALRILLLRAPRRSRMSESPSVP